MLPLPPPEQLELSCWEAEEHSTKALLCLCFYVEWLGFGHHRRGPSSERYFEYISA